MGTALMNFVMIKAIENGVQKIQLFSASGSWGFYYKLGFRPRYRYEAPYNPCLPIYAQEKGEPFWGYHLKPFQVDNKISLSMAQNLNLNFPEEVSKKLAHSKQLSKEGVDYFQKRYKFTDSSELSSGSIIKNIYWDNPAPLPAKPRIPGGASVEMVMNECSIDLFKNFYKQDLNNNNLIRKLGDEIILRETYTEFLESPILNYKVIIKNLAEKYNIEKAKASEKDIPEVRIQNHTSIVPFERSKDLLLEKVINLLPSEKIEEEIFSDILLESIKLKNYLSLTDVLNILSLCPTQESTASDLLESCTMGNLNVISFSLFGALEKNIHSNKLETAKAIVNIVCKRAQILPSLEAIDMLEDDNFLDFIRTNYGELQAYANAFGTSQLLFREKLYEHKRKMHSKNLLEKVTKQGD